MLEVLLGVEACEVFAVPLEVGHALAEDVGDETVEVEVYGVVFVVDLGRVSESRSCPASIL